MGSMKMYVMLLSVVVLLFHFAGLIANSPISLLLTLLLNPQNLASSSFYTILVNAIALASSVGIIIGLFVTQRTELIIKAAMVEFLVLVGWDLIMILNTLAQLSMAFAIIVISPLFITYFLTLYEWWTGND